MTVAPEQTAVALRRGRELVTADEFEMLAAFCADEYNMDRVLADRVMDQALAMIFVMGTTRSGDVMAPSQVVDPGWHTAILHTEWYADFCQQNFGYLLHHHPNSKMRTKGLMSDVTARIEAEGFHVDRILWGTAADCNAPTCCGDGPCC
ncbi:hypothetical protein J7F01_41045 [Streptomyces sp. ISL-22]|uniref:hypothetical protein n=1 Tax=unclassified Streptomyces TaxID=2593676 RepID=UPI001BEC79E6|nr:MULTISPECIES: hypothetical protein [unclassified Streptomyces]MBT2418370.1 hypothetical protein [Streptomyces sp. ISL-24]MBT2438379.1 hypothetical protein [Streptomyces sp. ISL-22]